MTIDAGTNSPPPLEELHRHRDFHMGQLNAVNFAGSIALVGLAVSIFFGQDFPKVPNFSIALAVVVVLTVSAVMLIIGVSLHWLWHAKQIRRIDKLINAQFPGLAHGLARDGSATYVLCGFAVILLALMAVFYLSYRILCPGPVDALCPHAHCCGCATVR